MPPRTHPKLPGFTATTSLDSSEFPEVSSPPPLRIRALRQEVEAGLYQSPVAHAGGFIYLPKDSGDVTRAAIILAPRLDGTFSESQVDAHGSRIFPEPRPTIKKWPEAVREVAIAREAKRLLNLPG